ncbi:hypothetical protein [Herbaspirillum chlorophenolicum]|uniref:hypothetical protein n=1 Tax=Herbaspirillum chlorophenolicum TaxID=211589 RepID=UPI00067B33A7|nr:hypothetical protein [Herbaspirillum chlorophenolicum]
MRDSQNCDTPACQEAADRAVKKVFAILGVDVDKPESVEEFREDLRFGRRMRRTADKARDHTILVFIGIMVAAVLGAIWAGITKFGGH